ncbi:alpha/beta hydrolase [Neptuniibacter sp.]|uniref:alpha/beta hydrolase n=1 Tax=Neptuniibacter sp. TaxID=1962643 RepID=UPI003B5C9483
MLPVPGTEKRVAIPAARALPVWIYMPVNINQPDRLIVAVHGISREYKSQLAAYKKLADKMGCGLLVPEFSRTTFPRYQQLAKDSSSQRADTELNTFLVALKVQLQQPFLKVHLCGYSGGAQFAHRYAMLYPQNVASLVLCSAGWYTCPDPAIEFPYGIAKWPAWLGKLRLEEMMKIPTLVMVGELDLKREKSLRKSKALDAQQGRTRVERAENWVEAINHQKQQSAYARVQYKQLLGVGHDFQASSDSGEMMSHIESFWKEIGREKICVA